MAFGLKAVAGQHRGQSYWQVRYACVCRITGTDVSTRPEPLLTWCPQGGGPAVCAVRSVGEACFGWKVPCQAGLQPAVLWLKNAPWGSLPGCSCNHGRWWGLTHRPEQPAAPACVLPPVPLPPSSTSLPPGFLPCLQPFREPPGGVQPRPTVYGSQGVQGPLPCHVQFSPSAPQANFCSSFKNQRKPHVCRVSPDAPRDLFLREFTLHPASR